MRKTRVGHSIDIGSFSLFLEPFGGGVLSRHAALDEWDDECNECSQKCRREPGYCDPCRRVHAWPPPMQKKILFSGFQAMGVGIFRIVSVHPAELRDL